MPTPAFTGFGKTVKKRLIDLDRSQAWLIERVATRTGLYFDRSYLHKVLTGQSAPSKIVVAVRAILELPDETENVS